MPTSAIDSLVFRNMFGDREVRQMWVGRISHAMLPRLESGSACSRQRTRPGFVSARSNDRSWRIVLKKSATQTIGVLQGIRRA
jgi:hypothetical protein